MDKVCFGLLLGLLLGTLFGYFFFVEVEAFCMKFMPWLSDIRWDFAHRFSL